MRKILLILFFCLFTNPLFSQGEFWNWYFGDLAGLTFNTPNRDPISLSGNPIFQYEGSATVSDAQGNLLFSTNGEQVFNFLGNKINIEKLNGHQSSTQSALIAKQPGSEKIYYVFTSDASEYVDPPNSGIQYSIVDMDANNGTGAMVATNIPLLAKASEKLATTMHANKKDIWILTKGWKNDNVYAFLLTENGIEDTVISSIGFQPTNNYHAVGQMKVSMQGTKIALTYQDVPFYEIYKFDNKTGIASEPLRINVEGLYNLYGVEFSSSGKLLYITNSRNSSNIYTLFQYQISIHDTTSIRKSEYVVSRGNAHVGSLQMAPNGWIYMAISEVDYLSEIRNPDGVGASCSFRGNGVSLDKAKSQLGLPNSIPLGSTYSMLINVCENDDFNLDPLDILQDTSLYEFDFSWAGPNAFTSKETKPHFFDATLADSGLYVLTVKYIVNGEEFIVSVTNHVRVNKRVKFQIKGKFEICRGQLTTLASDTTHPFFSYRWSTGSTAQHITVSDSGTYFLVIRNQRGCYDTAFAKVTLLETPTAEIIGNGIICDENSEVLLESVNISSNYTYLWTTGETTPTIKVNTPGTYGLKITNVNGCEDTASYNVKGIDKLQVVIEGDSVICVPGVAVLTARSLTDLSEYMHYFVWSTGDTSNTIIATKSGTYEVTLVVGGTCFAYDSRTLERNQGVFLEINKEGDIHICRGDTVNIFVIDPNDAYTYRWSDGLESISRDFAENGGEYTLYAFTPEGCIDSAMVNVIIHEKPIFKLNFEGEVAICESQTLTIHAEPKNPDFSYLWSNGATTDSIVVSKTGLYYLTVTNQFGCFDVAHVSVTVSDRLPTRITGLKTACEGDTLTLVANANYPDLEANFSYLWSTGETTRSIKVTQSDILWVNVSHSGGCEGSDTTNVNFYENPTVELKNSSQIAFCEGESFELSVSNPNDNYNYFWNDGSRGTSRIVYTSGIYKVYASNANVCIDSAEVEVVVHDAPTAKIIIQGEPSFCFGGSVVIDSELEPGTDFVWSTGETSASIRASEAGLYWFAAWNQLGCSDTSFFEIVELPEIIVDITSDKNELCTGEFAEISASDDFARYQWSTGETSKSIIVTEAGTYKLTVYDENDCMGESSITISEADDALPLIFKQLNDPKPCIGEEVIIEIEVLNQNQRFVTTKDFTFGTTKDMVLLDHGNVIDGFAPNTKKIVKISYIPTTTGDIVAFIELNCLGPCEFTSVFEFSVSPFMKTELTSPELIFNAGEEVCIDFEIEPKCEITDNISSGFEITISFAAEYFLPKTINIGTILENYVKDGRRYIKINTDNFTLSQNKQNLISICGSILLGADSISSIIVEDFQWDDQRIANVSNNGSLINLSCVNEIRGIQYYMPTSFKVNPMPASDNLRVYVNSGAIGEFELILVGFDGTQEILKKWENTKASHLEFEFDIRTKSQGVYNVLLKAPWSIHYDKIMVVR